MRSMRCSPRSRSRWLMSDFVEQCRAEWKRLGVPDAIAGEMAADLGSDIRDAESDGISVEELLGGSASDPRAFAASWANERGLVPTRRHQRAREAPSGPSTSATSPTVLSAGGRFVALLSGRLDLQPPPRKRR